MEIGTINLDDLNGPEDDDSEQQVIPPSVISKLFEDVNNSLCALAEVIVADARRAMEDSFLGNVLRVVYKNRGTPESDADLYCYDSSDADAALDRLVDKWFTERAVLGKDVDARSWSKEARPALKEAISEEIAHNSRVRWLGHRLRVRVLEAMMLHRRKRDVTRGRDSGHWALPREEREKLIDGFLSKKASGLMDNERAWIEANITNEHDVPYNTFRKWVSERRCNGAP